MDHAHERNGPGHIPHVLHGHGNTQQKKEGNPFHETDDA